MVPMRDFETVEAPHGRSSLCPETERKAAGAADRRGCPERESRTPVHRGNQPYRDNGEGVAATAATPLPL